MAFLELTKTAELPCFGNVHAAVGKGCINQRNDVLLVQYLLKTIYETYYPSATMTPPPAEPLIVDGHAGEITFKYIRHFQQSILDAGGSVRVDGRVDRAQGFTGVVTGSVYTILHLNHTFGVVRPADDGRLWMAFDCPSDLREALIAASKPKAGVTIETQGGGI